MTELLPAGIGLGFRFQHAPVILRDKPDTPWFELIADDLLLSSGRQRVIEKLREHYPIALHAVGLNIAGPDPLDTDYLSALASVYQHTEAAWLSDHLCWSAAGQRQHFDLLPFAFTHDMLDYLCPRIHQVQQQLKRPLVLENISYYQRFQHDEMDEWEFTAELMKRTDCKMLLDLNNLWTNARNFDLEPSAELDTLMQCIPADGIVQIHVAGSKFHPTDPVTDSTTETVGNNSARHSNTSRNSGSNPSNNSDSTSDHHSANGYWVDTHGEQVPAGVCDLLKTTYAAYGEIPTIIERDNNLPSFDELERERQTLLETVNG